MLSIFEKNILPERSQLLYDKPFCKESLAEDWEVASGEWWLDDGWLTGRIRSNSGGLIYSKGCFPGDILLDFYGRLVPPCINDLNFTWHSEGWDIRTNDAGIGYIAGINGWWTGKTGIERYPKCDFQALTPTPEYPSGSIYHIQAGIIGGRNFIFVDGRLVIEARDPEPIDSKKYGKIGFGCYCSQIQVKDLKVYKPAVEDAFVQYKPLF